MVGLLLSASPHTALLPVAALPNVNYPTIQVSAQLPGADPQTMASSVATPLEEQFGQIPGITQMTSVERARLHADQPAVRSQPHRRLRPPPTSLAAINAAGGQSAAQHDLPADDPQGEPGRYADPGSGGHIGYPAADDGRRLCGKHPAPEDLADLGRRPRRASAGSRSRPSGFRSIRRRLAARGISLEDVRNVLSQANVDLPKGTLNSPRQTYTLNTNDQLLKPEAYNDLIVAYRNGSPVRIRDIGKAIDGSGKRPAGRLVQSKARRSSWPFNASPAPMSSRRSTGSRRCCRSWRPRSRRPSRCRSSPTVPRPSAPRSATCSSR